MGQSHPALLRLEILSACEWLLGWRAGFKNKRSCQIGKSPKRNMISGDTIILKRIGREGSPQYNGEAVSITITTGTKNYRNEKRSYRLQKSVRPFLSGYFICTCKPAVTWIVKAVSGILASAINLLSNGEENLSKPSLFRLWSREKRF